MPHLLLIDATLGAVAIMVAAWIVVLSARRERPSHRHREVAGLAGDGTALGEMTVVPGLSEAGMDPDPGARGPDPDVPGPDSGVPGPDPGVPGPDPDVPGPDPDAYAADPGVSGPDSGVPGPDPGVPGPDPDAYAADPGAREPAGPEQAPPQASAAADAAPGADDPEPGEPEPARPQQAPPLGNGVARAGPGSHAPAAGPGGPPGSDGGVTSTGRVYTYYEGADQQMADYLAELGWSEESGARNPG